MSFNLAVILRETARRAPDRPVAVFDGGRLSYRQLDQASDRVAANLAAAGIEPGDRIALQLPNIPQFLISYFGILKAGAVVVPLNVLLRAPEIAFHLEDSGAMALITWEGVLAEAAKGAEAAGIGTIFAVGHPAGAAGSDAVRAAARRCGASAGDGDAGSPPTPRSSSTPRGPRASPRAPSSPTSSCT